MKHASFFLLALPMIGVLGTYAQNIVGQMPDGRNLQPTDTLFADATCVFSLDNKRQANWEIWLESSLPSQDSMVLSADSAECATLSLTPNLVSWFQLAKYRNGESVYHKGHVRAFCGEDEPVTADILVRVVPRKPRIVGVHLDYDSFDEHLDQEWFVNPRICFDVLTQDATQLSIYNWFSPTVINLDVCTVTDDIQKTPELPWYPDQTWSVSGSNKYGTSDDSDAIFVNDYIPQEMMRIIDNSYSGLGISDTSKPQDENGRLGIEPDERILSADCFSIGGKPVPIQFRDGSTILPTGQRGIFTIRIKTNKRTITKKVRL